MFHAKAYLRTEETRNLNIPCGESHGFSRVEEVKPFNYTYQYNKLLLNNWKLKLE
jgi:hypothetical protein